MRKVLPILLAIAAAAFAHARPAHAYNDAPWCSVVTLSPGGAYERCEFSTFESCRLEVVSGNRGFCKQNGYLAPVPRRRPHR